MQEINLFSGIEAAFEPSLLGSLSSQFGLSPDVLHRATSHAGSALIAAAMAVSASREGVSTLFSTVMSVNVNARIAEALPQLASTTGGLKTLENTGEAFVAQSTHASLAVLSDWVASSAGVPAQAAYAWCGVVAATLSGLLKREMLLGQMGPVALPKLLLDQWPVVAPQLNDALAGALGFDDAQAFRDIVPAQLRVLAGRLARECATEVAPELPAREAGGRDEPGTGGKRRQVWPILALLIVIVGAALVYVDLRFGGELPASILPSAIPTHPTPASVVFVPVPPVSDPAASSASGTAVASVSLAAASTAGAASAVSPASTPLPGGGASGVPAASGSEAQGTHLVMGVSRAGVLTIAATVATEGEKEELVDTLGREFGSGRFTADVTIDTTVRPAGWLAHLDALVPLMRTPSADVAIDGTHIELGGAAADALAKLRAQFGPDWQVAAFDDDLATAAATAAFRAALAARAPDGACEPQALSSILSLQIIDFAAGSASVPSSADENLRDTAQLIKACADHGHPVRLVIEAFSDSIGDEGANLDLSNRRAVAVRAQLVEGGVPSGFLTAHGYGMAEPVASNLTERGRFTNRRIMFVAVD